MKREIYEQLTEVVACRSLCRASILLLCCWIVASKQVFSNARLKEKYRSYYKNLPEHQFQKNGVTHSKSKASFKTIMIGCDTTRLSIYLWCNFQPTSASNRHSDVLLPLHVFFQLFHSLHILWHLVLQLQGRSSCFSFLLSQDIHQVLNTTFRI